MTFKEQYSLDNEKLHVSEELEQKILQKQQERAHSKTVRTKILRYGSIAACFLLIGIAFVTRNVDSPIAGMKMATESNSVSEIEQPKEMFAPGSAADVHDANDFRREESISEQMFFAAETPEKNEVSVVQETAGSVQVALDEKAQTEEKASGIGQKVLLLLIPFIVLVVVMVAWAVFRRNNKQ